MESTVDFKSFGLDPRLMKAITKMGYTNPTLIQAEAIPLALQGKDILARAKTGSGKTAAYCIPLIQKILRRKDEEASLGGSNPRVSKLAGLILVPTKELSEQVKDALAKFTYYTYRLITVCNLCSQAISPENAAGASEASASDIVIGTPGTVSKALDLEWLDVTNLEMLVLDEADLLFSFGYQADLEVIAGKMPRICQGMLMSATLTGEVEDLKKLVLRTPVILKLTEPEGGEDEIGGHVTEYTVPIASDNDRFTALFALLKLNVISGKIIIFVKDVLRCFRLRLFFDRFSIRSTVLNSNLPLISRLHTIQEFNRGAIQILIAADDSDVLSEGNKIASDDDDDDDENEEGNYNDSEEEEEDDDFSKGKKGKKGAKGGIKKLKNGGNVSKTEFSMSRGVDFVGVAGVINFDMPNTVESYVHRIGRTGRGTSSGVAISFFSSREEEQAKEIIEARRGAGHEVKPYEIKNAILGSFRYRTEEILRKVTLNDVKRANDSEIKAAILNSEKLRDHFRENPREAFLLRGQLRHAKRCRGKRELRTIPEYMLPPGLGGKTASELIQDVEIGKEDPVGMLGRKRVRHGSDIARKPMKKKKDEEYIPVSLGGKRSGSKKKSDLNAAFKSKRKYGRK